MSSDGWNGPERGDNVINHCTGRIPDWDIAAFFLTRLTAAGCSACQSHGMLIHIEALHRERAIAFVLKTRQQEWGEKEQLIITFFGQTLNDFYCRGEFRLQAASVLLLRHAGSQQRWHEGRSRHLSSEKVAEKLGYSEALHRFLYCCQPVLSRDARCLYVGCWAVPCWSATRHFPTWLRPSGGLFLKAYHEVYTHRCADYFIMQQKSNPDSAQGWATRR